MTDDATLPQIDPTGPTALERPLAPLVDPLERAVARAAAEAALFGEAEPVKVGRYRVIERAGAGGMGVVWSAWDPELGRGVALKLASAGDDRARARARDEGRALARLSHPNVVPIYDVVDVDAGVMLVMELVTGKTLRAVAADGATAAQLLRAYRQAGEGLAAAHRAGLIHRDFKPDNAILGADGRVRVLDFGLAHEVPPDGASATTEIAGTPRYMAPEQRAGDELTAAVDQYALCVALREALGAHGTVPRWLAPILARGTAATPGERYPSMDELVRVLALDPATRWRRRGVVVLGAVAIGGSIAAFTIGRAAQAESPCEGGPALIAASWGGDRRAAARAHLDRLATPYAAATAPRLLATLDSYATAWVGLQRASCKAHRRGEISAALLDRRAGCLARRRAALGAVAELVTTVTADGLADLVVAAGALPDLAACDDDAALLAAVEPPPAAKAAEAAAIGDLISRVDVERDAGRIDAATRDAAAAVARAQQLGYRPLVARALLARGRIALQFDFDERGANDFALATREALAAGDEPVAIEAFARRVWARATTTERASATDGLELIEALTERLGDRARFPRALLRQNLGGVALARGDRAAARTAFERARVEAAALVGGGAIELTGTLSNLLLVVDDPGERARIATELIAVRTRLFGAHHPRTLHARVLAAQQLEDLATFRVELARACHDLARYHPNLGTMIGECGLELTWLAAALLDRAAVRSNADLVIAAATHDNEPDVVETARGYRALARAEVAEAQAIFTRLEAAHPPGGDLAWWEQLTLADLALARGLGFEAARDPVAARAALARASQLYDRVAAAMPTPVINRRRQALATVSARLGR